MRGQRPHLLGIASEFSEIILELRKLKNEGLLNYKICKIVIGKVKK